MTAGCPYYSPMKLRLVSLVAGSIIQQSSSCLNSQCLHQLPSAPVLQEANLTCLPACCPALSHLALLPATLEQLSALHPILPAGNYSAPSLPSEFVRQHPCSPALLFLCKAWTIFIEHMWQVGPSPAVLHMLLLISVSLASCAAPPAGQLTTGASLLETGTLCVEVGNARFANGQQLMLSPCSGSLSQQFKAGNSNNSNRIETVYTTTAGAAFCLDVYARATTAGTSVTLYSCSTGTNQQWAVDSNGRLTPAHAAGMCLDTEGSSPAAGAKLVINPCSDASTQKILAVAAAGRL
jgi:hypothetical protein